MPLLQGRAGREGGEVVSGWFFVTLMTEKCMHVVGAVYADGVADAIEFARPRVGEHGMRLEAVPEYAARHEVSPPKSPRGWKQEGNLCFMYPADEIRLKVSTWKRCLELHVGDYSPCCGAEMLHEKLAGLPLYQVKGGIKVYDMRCSKCRKKMVAKGGEAI